MVSMVIVSWELMLFSGMSLWFDIKNVLHSVSEVKCLQGSSRTLLPDNQCLRITYRVLRDDLVFNAVSPGLGHPSLFTVYNFSFRGREALVQKTMGIRKFYKVL